MAKRAPVQLQAELENDEDFENFLLNPGLLVIDVYAEWCGPCIALVNTLKRIKLDVGSDLVLAIAKCDTISCLQRFYKKSEPTWLFISDNYVVNLMFGTSSSELTNIIYEELRQLRKTQGRKLYKLHELLPEEEQRLKIKNDIIIAQRSKEIADQEREKYEYFKYFTDLIRENLPDMGVIIFAPHIGRDAVFKTVELGRQFNIQCKDRRTLAITKEKFQEINYVCRNPLSEEIIDVIADKELIVSLWRVTEQGDEKVPTVLRNFSNIVTKPRSSRADDIQLVAYTDGPYIGPEKFQVEYELPDDQECPHYGETEREDTMMRSDKMKSMEENESILEEFDADEMGSEEYEELPDGRRSEPMIYLGQSSVESFIEPENVLDINPKKYCKKTVNVPGLWIPEDSRTHAALIYHLFRSHTVTFVPPDPIPEPPHVVMAFHTYKQRDLLEFATRYKDDIPAYGYFTSDDVDDAKFIANSKQKYAHYHPHSVTDKLVLKVNKQTSNTMLSLVGYGPTYVSLNTEIGEKEAQKFFPPEYETAEQEMSKLAEEEREKQLSEQKKTQSKRLTKSSQPSLKEEIKKVEENSSSEYDENENLLGEEEEYMDWVKGKGIQPPNKDGQNAFSEEAGSEEEAEAIYREPTSAPENEEEVH